MTNRTEPVASPIDIVGRYLAVWSETDPEGASAGRGRPLAPDGVEFVEAAQFRGHEQLEARIAEACQEFVESGKYAVDVRARRDRP